MGGLIYEGIFLGIQNNLKIRSIADVFLGFIGSLIFAPSRSSLSITSNDEYLGYKDNHLYSLLFGQAEGGIYFNTRTSFQLAPKTF